MLSKEEEDEFFQSMIAEKRLLELKWINAKKELDGLIHPKYFDFAEINDGYSSEGVVEIEETDERTSAYPQYKHCRIKNTDDRRLYVHHTDTLETLVESKHDGEPVEYWVWQTTGYCGDDYSGYLLLPMLDGRYWKISYSC